MRRRGIVLAAALPAALVLFLCGFAANTSSSLDVPIVVTAAPAYDPLAALSGGERFPKGAQLLTVRDGKAEPLVAGFAATADANVSFDAKTVLFAGKKVATDPWQIWELKLADHSLRQLIAGTTDVVRPLYLPGNRVVFARRTANGFQLEAAGIDGRGELPLTYMAASALPADVLADGRILFEAGFPLGSGSTPELFLVYSDGSGVESYRCDHGSARWGGKQLASGDVVFTHGMALARFTSPLANEVRIPAPRADYAGAIAETPSGAWLMSARTGVAGHYALTLWNPPSSARTVASRSGSAGLSQVLARNGEDLVEPMLIAPRTRPRQHPSALHDWNYANLLALDARQSRDGALKATPARLRLETLDTSGRTISLGMSAIEGDGSFFVKTPADRPIRFVLLDEKGAVLRQEQGWFWIRRGEQRICVGCHAGPEHAAENRVPAVLLRTTTPTDLSGTDMPNTARQATQGSR
jgi:hypothetical protein